MPSAQYFAELTIKAFAFNFFGPVHKLRPKREVRTLKTISIKAALLGGCLSAFTGCVGAEYYNGSENFQGTELSAADVAAVTPDPAQALPAYNAAGGCTGPTTLFIPRTDTPLAGATSSTFSLSNLAIAAAPDGR